MNTIRNRVQLIGRIGSTPEIVLFEDGKKLAKISLATNEVYKNPMGDKVEAVHWHQAFAWGKQAELFEKHVRKGQEIAIEGKLINRSYQSKDGEKRSSTEVQINGVLLLGSKSTNGK